MKLTPLTPTQIRKKNKGLCLTIFCRKSAKGGNYCYSCQKRRFAEKHPVTYAFMVTRQNARRRGKDWSLTIEEFKVFCIESDYIALKGTAPASLSIDRVKNEYGYHFWNIRGITVSENSTKRNWQDFNKGPDGEPVADLPF